MCDERQCKRQPNNDYCHCEDHYMQMSIADCAPRSNTGCTPYQLEALENMCKMSCKENPLEYLIRAEANERAQATEAEGKTEGKAKGAAKPNHSKKTSIPPIDDTLKIKKQEPALKKDEDININLSEQEIAFAIKMNKDLIKKYDKNKSGQDYEKARILQSVGSSSKDFDRDSILAIAHWQAKRNLTPTGIYDNESRKIDFLLTAYDAAADNTDINILFVIAQLSYESGWKFQKSHNYGGIKAPTEGDKGLKPLDPKHAVLHWTSEDWSDEEFKAKQKAYENDPNRKPWSSSGKKITYMRPSTRDANKNRYKVQEYFQTFSSMSDFIQTHRTNIIGNITKKVTDPKYQFDKRYKDDEDQQKKKTFYEPDPSLQQEKIRTIIQDADKIIEAIQFSKRKYATSTGYEEHITARMAEVEKLLKQYNLTATRIQNQTNTDKPNE